ncbi:MAG: LysR family transcriptional regulator [Desulfobacterales bacterium]|nr:LysR family transcriptional regulator [Desulfobacterales bacterium]
MDLWQLNIFCKVVELKSFSKTAELIRLSQPTISSHMKDLENHFGCRLIDRLSKEAVPTEAGKLLYHYALKLTSLRDETETALAEFHGKMKGRLTVGGSTIPGQYILPKLIGNFIRKYPDVRISLKIGDTDTILDNITSGETALGIVGATTAHKQLIQEKVFEDSMCLVVPTGHKWAKKKQISMALLHGEPFIIRESGSGTLKSIQRGLSDNTMNIHALNIIAELGSTEAVRQGIKNNLGVSILSRLAVAEDIKTGTLKSLDIKELNLAQSFYLTTHKHRSQSPICSSFNSFIKTSLLSFE